MAIKLLSHDDDQTGLKISKIGAGSLMLLVTSLVVIGLGVKLLSEAPKDTSAVGGAISLIDSLTINPAYEQYLEDVRNGKGEEYELIPNKYVPAGDDRRHLSVGTTGATNLPARYSLIDAGYGTKIKNQGADNSCWAYAITSAMESYLLKNNNKALEFSPKQLDYYYASDNPIDKYAVSAFGGDGYKSRNVGDGHNLLIATLGLSTGQVPVSESEFFQVMRQNDAVLRNYNTWNDYQDHTILDQISGIATAYTKAMNYNNQITAIDNHYLATNAVYVAGSSSTDLSQIKQSVMEHGAAIVGTIAPEVDACWDAETKTIIDRGSIICGASNGHAMIIVGWDDNHTYTNPSDNSTKTGAFILQNSWGTSDYFSRNGYTLESLVENGLVDISGYTEGQRQIISEIINNWDAEEIIYLGYELASSYSSATEFLMLEEIEDNTFDGIYHVTGNHLKSQTIDLEHENDSIVFTYSTSQSDTPEIIKELSIYSITPYRVEVAYDLSLDSGDGFVKLGSVTYPAYTAGAKFIKLSNPVEISGDFRLKLTASVDGRNESLEGVDKYYAMAAFTNFKTTTDPSGPSDPTDPTEPTDPSDPSDPSDPTDPTDPSDPEEPANTGRIEWKDDNDLYLVGFDSELVVSIDYPLSAFESLLIDDEEVDEENYDLKSGSTIITLHGDYLDTLEPGEHILKAVFSNNRVVTAEFAVAGKDIEIPSTSTDKPTAPETGISTKTGDNNTPAMIHVLPILGTVIIIAGIIVRANKTKIVFNNND